MSNYAPRKRRYDNSHHRPNHTQNIHFINKKGSGSSHVENVRSHYNVIKENKREQRQYSEVYPLRCFNNWVKQVQIDDSVELVKCQNIMSFNNSKKSSNNEHSSSSLQKGIKVLDLCCGKGGDINKWKKSDLVKHIDFVDLSEDSITEASKRYNNQQSCKEAYSAEFFVGDCTQKLNYAKILDNDYDICQCQFALHYAFETCTQAETMIGNVANKLKPGGIFIGTTVNDFELVYRAKQQKQKLVESDLMDPNENTDKNGLPISFGNSVYKISLDENSFDLENPPLFGCKYRFNLDDLIDQTEFMINRALLVQICKEHNLELIYFQPFRQFFDKHKDNAYYRKLLKVFKALGPFHQRRSEFDENNDPNCEFKRARMSVQALIAKGSDNKAVGTIKMSMWEIATLYTTFCFRKKGLDELDRVRNSSDDDDEDDDQSDSSSENESIQNKNNISPNLDENSYVPPESSSSNYQSIFSSNEPVQAPVASTSTGPQIMSESDYYSPNNNAKRRKLSGPGNLSNDFSNNDNTSSDE